MGSQLKQGLQVGKNTYKDIILPPTNTRTRLMLVRM